MIGKVMKWFMLVFSMISSKVQNHPFIFLERQIILYDCNWPSMFSALLDYVRGCRDTSAFQTGGRSVLPALTATLEVAGRSRLSMPNRGLRYILIPAHGNSRGRVL
jgi:hypothetical protein